MSDSVEKLKGFVEQQAEGLSEVLLTTTESDVGTAALMNLMSTVKAYATLEELTIKEQNNENEKDISLKKLELDAKRLEHDNKSSQDRIDLDKDIQKSKVELDKERLGHDAKKLEFDKDIQERKLDLDAQKIESDEDLQKAKLEFEKQKLEAEQQMQADKLDLESQKFEFEKDIQQQRLELDKKKLENDKDIQQQKLDLEADKIANDRADSERKAEEAKAQRKSEFRKSVIAAGIGLLSASIPLVVTAIIKAKAEESKAEFVKEIFNGIVQSEQEGTLPFAGATGSILKTMVDKTINN